MSSLTTSSTTVPEVYIKRSKNRTKIYGTKNIYLKDGETFELELFNPLGNSVLAKIYVNNTLISSNGLVIKPGQRIYLERFLDSNNKFKFVTYEVESGNRQVSDAIAHNGEIKVEFFNQVVPISFNNTTAGTYVVPAVHHHHHYDYYHYPYRPYWISQPYIYCNSVPLNNGLSGGLHYGSSANLTSNGVLNLGNSYNSSITYSAGDGSVLVSKSLLNEEFGPNSSIKKGLGSIVDGENKYSINFGDELNDRKDRAKQQEFRDYIDKHLKAEKKTEETGTIDKGESSDQKFVESHESFTSVAFHTIEYKILPVSQKLVESEDIRNYCTGCGDRVRNSNWKFCPKCGTKVE